jgi:hypothetical protein
MPGPDNVACDGSIRIGLSFHRLKGGCTDICKSIYIARLCASPYFGSKPSFSTTAPNTVLVQPIRWLTLHFSLLPVSGGPSLSRDSDGRFRLRRSRANLTQNHFGTHRAFIHALPPSPGLPFVPFSVPSVFVRWRSQVKNKNRPVGAKLRTASASSL